MAKKNEWDIVDDLVFVDNVYDLEPYSTWNENFLFWFKKYLYSKCEEHSKRFVSEANLPKVLEIQNKLLDLDNIEMIGKLVNELSRLKFKSIKNYYNHVSPLFYFLQEHNAYSIKNITANLLIAYFSNTKEKDDASFKIRNIKISRNVKRIYELSYASKIIRLTIILNFINFIQDNNIEKVNSGGYSFDIKRKDILKQIKKEKRVVTVLTPKDGFQKFFRAISEVPYKDNIRERNVLILKLFMYLGLRVSELLYLKKEDIMIDDQNVKFNIIGKGNKQRILFVKYSHVKKHMDKYEKIRIESPEGYYFTTLRGKQINDRYINTIVSNTLKMSGLNVTKKTSVHMIRHSTASYLKHNLKMDNASISKWLGHEDIKTTMIYLHYTEQEILDMAEDFEEIV